MPEIPTVLVAGATGNVGGGACLALARRGARVVLLGRAQERLDSRRALILEDVSQGASNDPEPHVETLCIELTDLHSVRNAAYEALLRFPSIQGLVLSSVVYVQGGPKILPNGHEMMFAANVLGPFLLTRLLLGRLSQSHGIVLHVVAPFFKSIDWEDLESIRHHRTETAYNRNKTMGRMVAAELAHRYGDNITSVAFDPTFIIDRTDPELRKRWPGGFVGLLWKVLADLIAKPPLVAGEPIADLVLLPPDDRRALNGALFQLRKQLQPDRAMEDRGARAQLWRILTDLEDEGDPEGICTRSAHG